MKKTMKYVERILLSCMIIFSMSAVSFAMTLPGHSVVSPVENDLEMMYNNIASEHIATFQSMTQLEIEEMIQSFDEKYALYETMEQFDQDLLVYDWYVKEHQENVAAPMATIDAIGFSDLDEHTGIGLYGVGSLDYDVPVLGGDVSYTATLEAGYYTGNPELIRSVQLHCHTTAYGAYGDGGVAKIYEKTLSSSRKTLDEDWYFSKADNFSGVLIVRVNSYFEIDAITSAGDINVVSNTERW